MDVSPSSARQFTSSIYDTESAAGIFRSRSFLSLSRSALWILQYLGHTSSSPFPTCTCLRPPSLSPSRMWNLCPIPIPILLSGPKADYTTSRSPRVLVPVRASCGICAVAGSSSLPCLPISSSRITGAPSTCRH
jgi:hypothetical protein